MSTDTLGTRNVGDKLGTTPTPQDHRSEREASALRTWKLRQFLIRHPRMLIAAWGVVVLAVCAALASVYLCWYFVPPYLFKWTAETWWHWIPGGFAVLLLYCGPIWAGMGVGALTGLIADLSLAAEDLAIRHAQQTVHEKEQEAISRLEQSDSPGLLPLLKYSRAQLEAYYTVGLSQTRRSFFNSVLAMWLGFVLLLLGVAIYVGPVEAIGLKPPSGDFRWVIMGGAAIVEFISALFLWVYRSATVQQYAFYNRQMHAHTVILCFRIASTMEKAQADETKRAIVEKALEWTTAPMAPAPAGAKGFGALLPMTARTA